MYIEFQKVRYKNFLSTGNYFNEVVLNSVPTTLLAGESGSGKTTFLDSISFALFNCPFRNINKPGLMNSLNQKECLVEIEFKIGSKQYKVVRGLRPITFEIYCDNVLINQDSHSKDYQKYLEDQILGFNYSSFTQIVILGAANFVPFMKLKPYSRRLIIEDLLDMQIFSMMNSVLKEQIAATKTKQTDLENRHFLLTEKKKIHEQHITELAKDRKEIIKQNMAKAIEFVQTVRSLNYQIRRNNIELENKRQVLLDDGQIYGEITKISSLHSQLFNSKKKLEKQCAFYLQNDECPTCSQKIQPEFKQQEMAKKKSSIEKINDGLGKLEIHLDKLNAKKDKNAEVKASTEDIEQAVFRLQTQKQNYLAQIQSLKKENERLGAMKTESTGTDQQKIDAISDELKTNLKEQQELKYSRQLQDVALSVLKDTGIKARIIKQYLPIINKHINKYLAAMNFFVSFFIDENFDEKIKSRGRDEFCYGNFSEGEKQRIDLALLFTWRAVAQIKNSVNTNLLVIDELLDSYLDQTATENVIELINSDMFKKMNIFVISHKNTIRDKFHNTLDFVKTNNFSRIL